MRGTLGVVVMLAATLVSPAHAEGDAKRGERIFKFCFSCHSVDPNERAKLQGPSLAGIVGRRAGAIAGYEYSEALRAKAAAGLLWTRDILDRYVLAPDDIIPGGRMAFPGIKDAADRADLMAYLERAPANQ